MNVPPDPSVDNPPIGELNNGESLEYIDSVPFWHGDRESVIDAATSSTKCGTMTTLRWAKISPVERRKRSCCSMGGRSCG